MAIHYYVQPRESYYGNERKTRYFLIAKSVGRLNRKDLIKYMTQNVSLTSSEAASALDYLLEAIPRFLQLGLRLDLGDLGSINTTIRSEGSATPEEATVHKVKEICIHFKPSKKLKLTMKNTPLVKNEKRYTFVRRKLMTKKNREEIALQEKKEIALRALEKGLSPEIVAELTGLDINVLQEFK